jgi:6-phosphogluconolactonase
MMPSFKLLLSVVTPIIVCLFASGAALAAEQTLYVGTYTRGTDSRGIYVYRFDDATGALAPVSIAEDVENPSFLALHPNRKFLFSSDEVDTYDGQTEGAISAWAIDDKTDALALINRVGAGGTSPCHLIVDPAGRNVLAVGYGSGTVAVFPIDADGRLQSAATRIEHHGASVDPVRQTSPHPHQVVLDPTATRAWIPDLGLDQIVAYEFDSEKGALTPSDPPAVPTAPGAGPRHLAFHPNGRHAFSINELDLTITAFDYDPDRGILTPRETISAIDKNADRMGVSGAEIEVHPNGKFLYASLRGTDEIVAYKIVPDEINADEINADEINADEVDARAATLKFLERIPSGGKKPRNFTIDPTGQWLLAANQDSGNLQVFHIEPTGQLKPTSNTATIPAPVCLKFK